jgi:hypothetical protein
MRNNRDDLVIAGGQERLEGEDDRASGSDDAMATTGRS